MSDLTTLNALAARQHGLVSRQQIRELGIDRQSTLRLVERGQLSVVTPRVLKVGGSATSPWQSVMVGILDTGHDALASHATAAALWGVPGIRAEPVHVSISRVLNHRDPGAVLIHRMTVIPGSQRAALHDIPLTGPALTVLQICGVDPFLGGRVLDGLLAARLLTVAETWDLVDDMSIQGRNGLVSIRKLLDDRSDAAMPPQSNNERRFEQICREGGIDTLERQVVIRTPAWVGRVDYRDTELPMLLIEIQSDRYHTTSAHRRADALRIARLEAAGYLVVQVWEQDIWTSPEQVVERIRKIRASLLYGTFRPVSHIQNVTHV